MPKSEKLKKKPKYLCINCKKEFDKIPPEKKNECPTGYYHRFVKTKHIIKRRLM